MGVTKEHILLSLSLSSSSASSFDDDDDNEHEVEDEQKLKFVDIDLKDVEQRFNRVTICNNDHHALIPTIDTLNFDHFTEMQQNSEFDGRLTKKELKKMLLISASINSLSINEEDADLYTSLIMRELDIHKTGYIELNQLNNLIKTTTSNNTRNQSQSQIQTQQQEASSIITVISEAEMIFRSYWRRVWVMSIWVSVCVGLFTWKFIQYQNRAAYQVMGYCLSAAKGAAETLKFNMALILIPVSRNLLTWFRKSNFLTSVLPFNDNINFHKVIAGGIVIGVILHGGTHLACDLPRISQSNSIIFQTTFGNRFGNQQPSYLQVLCTVEVATGVAMVILMAIAFVLATKIPRRRSTTLVAPIRRVTGYNTFWYSHHLLILVYVLLIVHSMFLFLANNFVEKTTWMYLMVPVLIYTGERIYRSIRSETNEVDILEANMYPGKVLHLKLSKPAKFTYKSGMYTYIKCPHISPFEWHPFSLTSGPNDNFLSVHIRTLGDWSYNIHSLFQEVMMSKPFYYPKVYIDGPYGAASQDHVKYDVVVMIGLGIGATPFISVLKDIGATLQERLPNHGNDVESGVNKGPLKAYFYWVTREHGSLDWFKDSMTEIYELSQNQKVIEMYNYLTCVYPHGDARSILLSIAQYLYFAKTGIDIFSKTQVKTHFSRPNWSKIFSSLAQKHTESSIGVFYCGSSCLAKELEGLCTKLSTTTTTRFVFHKENY